MSVLSKVRYASLIGDLVEGDAWRKRGIPGIVGGVGGGASCIFTVRRVFGLGIPVE